MGNAKKYNNPYETEILNGLNNPDNQNTHLATLIPTTKPRHAYSLEHKNAAFDYIEEQIVTYGRSVRSVMTDDNLPDTTTLFKWLGENSNLSQRYAHALRSRADFWADEILRIAYKTNLDYYIDKEGSINVIGEAVQRSRVKIDTLKWLMAKVHPNKYGDKINHELTGLNGGAIKVEAIDYSQLSDSAIREILKATNKPTDNGGSSDSI
jgi:hypothetical protein